MTNYKEGGEGLRFMSQKIEKRQLFLVYRDYRVTNKLILLLNVN